MVIVVGLVGCNKDVELSYEEQMASDTAEIDAYLEENNITDAIEHTSGIRFVIQEEGTGIKPQPGQQVKVDYTGTLLSGQMFDSSVADDAELGGIFNSTRNYVPIEFTLGIGQVIAGWDIGIGLLNEGTIARLYIPSPLAYGSSERSDVIVANSILVFKVNLIDVID